MEEKPFFLEYSQQKADRLSKIIEKFYETNAQQSFHMDISQFLTELPPYELESILINNINPPSFEDRLEYSLGQLNVFFDFFDPNYYKDNGIKDKISINESLKEWKLENDQRVLVYQKDLVADSRSRIGTVFLVFSENNFQSVELSNLRRFSGSFPRFFDGDFFQTKKNTHFIFLLSIPVIILLILYLIYYQASKIGHLKKLSPEVNIVILTITLCIILIVYFCIGPSSVSYQDQQWYAERLLEKAEQQKNYHDDKLAEDYLQDIKKKHLPGHRKRDLSSLKKRHFY